MATDPRGWYVQGRWVTPEDLDWIGAYVHEHPEARRKRIAIALCEHWGWRNGRGQLKEMAGRSLLNKLADQDLVSLPPLRPWVRRNPSEGRGAGEIPVADTPIEEPLRSLRPLSIHRVKEGEDRYRKWAGYLRHYHYLGLRIVGENMGYLVRDAQGRDVAALLFGGAAWRCASRDQHLGWKNDRDRAEGLGSLANNTRFLILPWVRSAHLASHILGIIQRRVSADWQEKYGHGLRWLETFVDTERFVGTCYRAANWVEVGQTQGRGRQGRDRHGTLSRKYVLLYSLEKSKRRGSS